MTRSQDKVEAISDRDKTLIEIQNRVLWLYRQMVHYANNVRPNADGAKVGGHQASSSSLATVMTSLYFDFMRAGDRISVKPHASPVYHAIQFLLGNLDQKYLKRLREFHGLQAYPSKTKDPDPVDFSTGSVGLGAVAPNFAALVDEYTLTHFNSPGGGHRYISVVGDAELDEGVVWEAIAEPSMEGLSNILWVVDLNRQSLDRVIPGIRVGAWRQMFAAQGWRVIDAKYGKRLHAAFAEPRGELLREAIDDMPNEVYQRLLRVDPATLRAWLPQTSSHPEDMSSFIGQWDDQGLQDLFRNLGGHDFSMLREALTQADVGVGPNVIFAYTLKGSMLPSIGDPQNHSVTLSDEPMEELRQQLDIPEDELWSPPAEDTAAGRLCAETSTRLRAEDHRYKSPPELSIPHELGHPYRGNLSTQQAFGLVLTGVSRSVPDVADRIVTVSPDVASSTNLGGWINRAGVWNRNERGPMPEEGIMRALKWEESPRGQHIELGISENNLFIMLGQVGVSFDTSGELLFPIGTVYDPFIRRGLDAFVYSVYSGGKFIVVGTPSGITLAPEGGAHQEMATPSLGVELAELDYYEPCFGQELEWIMLAAFERIRLRQRSTYLRLNTRRVDQELLMVPGDVDARERMRTQVLGGAYRLIDRRTKPGYRAESNAVNIMACGALVPEAVEASRQLLEEGVMANVINITGPGPLYIRFQESVRATMQNRPAPGQFMEDVVPIDDRRAPVVTVADGLPHSLAWIGGALNTSIFPLGVTGFGQSGSRHDLYQEYEIDASSIMAACFGALESQPRSL